MLTKAVIVAGGFGTRLSSLYPDVPKALVPIMGKTILQRQLEILRDNGIKEIYITLGHKADKVESFLKENEFGVKTHTIVENEPMGTGGALYFLKDKLKESFFVCMGDILFDMDIQRLASFHEQKKAAVTLVVHPNSHPYDSDLIVLDQQEKAVALLSKTKSRPDLYNNIVNAGAYVFSAKVFEKITKPTRIDLEKDIIAPMMSRGEGVYGYNTSEYLKDVGTPKRVKQAEFEFSRGTVSNKNLKKKQRAIFLDRDGTINKYQGLISQHNDFELEDCAAEAITKINQSSYLAIAITNQPVIARNLCNLDELAMIHQKMDVLLGLKGAYLDKLFFCPHHPDSGYPEERKEYKIKCKCRKPATGMIKEAEQKYNLDLSRCWIIGDSTLDIQAGINANVKAILVKTGVGGTDKKYPAKPCFVANNLLEAVNFCLESRNN